MENADPEDPFVFKFTESHHSMRLMDGLSHLRDSSKFFDVKLVADGGKTFSAHRVVLASCSSYFYAMFTGGMKESTQRHIVLHGVDGAALQLLLHFMYTSKIELNQHNVVEVLYSARQLQMDSVVDACTLYMSSTLALHNCIELEKMTDMLSLPELRQEVLCFMCKNWAELMFQPEFVDLSMDQLRTVLQSDYPVYCPEGMVLHGLLSWVSHDLDHRACFLSEVVSLVQCNNLSSLDMDRLRHSPELQEVVRRWPDLPSLLREPLDLPVPSTPGIANTRGYVQTLVLVGGYQQSDHSQYTNHVRYLDFEARDYAYCGAILGMRQANYGTAVADNKLYVVGGSYEEQFNFSEQTHSYGYRLTLETNQWQSLPSMEQERCRFYLGALHGKLYAVGGELDNIQCLEACEVLDLLTLKWSSIAPLPEGRADLAGAVLNGQLYVSGGHGQPIGHDVSDHMYRYNPDLDQWTTCSPMLTPRTDHTMFIFRDHVYVIGGHNQNTRPDILPYIDRYSPSSNSWERLSESLHSPRPYSSYTVLQDQLWVVGGHWGDHRDHAQHNAEVLDLPTMTWRPQPLTLTLPATWEHSAVVMHVPRKAGPQAWSPS